MTYAWGKNVDTERKLKITEKSAKYTTKNNGKLLLWGHMHYTYV